ncbi:hypothetical protein CYMTET_15065 [Cymbomonas tetramitiformis]|uniref:C2H2-type domain-containing protein n=1 Tax=Cymbomonas tetramitiformis TaxID=36881 RepID=A0AAE0GF43_9CHLO|nr:hypothetical protein CYMTET_15065 [Cymbomonas tetramitiformis]
MGCSILQVFLALLCATGTCRDLEQLAPSQSDDRERSSKILLTSRTIDVSKTQTLIPGLPAPSRQLIETLSARADVKAQLLRDPRWLLLSGACQQYFATFSSPPTAEQRQDLVSQLKSDGGWIVGYVPHNTFLMVASRHVAERLGSVAGVSWVGEFESKDKRGPIFEKISREYSKNASTSADSGAFLMLAERLHLETIEMPAGRRGLVVEVLLPPLASPSGTAPNGSDCAEDFSRTVSSHWVAGLNSLRTNSAASYSSHPGRKPSIDCARSSTRVLLVLGFIELEESLQWLSDQSLAHYITPHHRRKHMNYDAAPVLQSGTDGSEDWAVSRPFWAAGLQGTGQIVGCGDTGVDMDSCFFRDDTGQSIGAAHRKVVLYNDFGDTIDSDGHGTHVSGSILGNSAGASSNSDYYNGVAFGAKLAFHDLSNGGSGLLIPGDTGADYYAISYDVGARLHSDSWGEGTGEYTTTSREVDMYTWQNQDFLPIFAAGNYGENSFSRSVTSPATAKNCLAVGATLSTVGDPPYVYGDVLEADFGPSLEGVFGTRLYVVEGAPKDGCSALTNAASIAGNVVLLDRGTCYFTDKVRRGEAAGAVAVIILNNDVDGYIKMSAPSWDPASDIAIPSGLMARSTGDWLKPLIRNAALDAEYVEVELSDADRPRNRFDNMADFSSVGPTLDGRIKPDLTAPGESIVSAGTDGRFSGIKQCYVAALSGTSMSTPLVAGAAALVRQYFVDGYYPSKTATPADSFNPSGALIKAAVLNGAAEMTGFTEAGFPLDPPPSIRQGFGRLQLNSSLPLSNTPEPGFNLFLVDKVEVQTGDIKQYCVQVDVAAVAELRVTLVWHDYPALTISSKDLVNDLDLVVRSDATGEVLGNGGTEADRVNNVERVRVLSPPVGRFVVEVVAHNIPSPSAQPYALVITGAFTSAGQCVGAQITTWPTALVGAGQPVVFTFELSSSSAQAQCELVEGGDSGGARSGAHSWVSCASPRTYTGLGDGTYTFKVREGGMESDSDSWQFVVDNTPPVTVFREDLQELPPAVSSNDAVSFYFAPEGSADEASVQFECQLESADWDGAHSWRTCSSPATYEAMPDGSYSFSVRGIDEAGNTEVTPVQHQWTVAAMYLQTVIIEHPDELITSNSVTFRFAMEHWSEGLLITGYQCRIRSKLLVELEDEETVPFESCISPVTYSELPEGAHQFQVRGVASGGLVEQTPEQFEFTIYAGAPAVSITAGPPAITSDSAISVHFEADEPDSEMECRVLLANGTGMVPWSACTSPQVFLTLPDNRYVIVIAALDQFSVRGLEASVEFLLDRTPPTAVIGTPTSPTSSVEIRFTGSDGARGSGLASATCMFDGTEIPQCNSPFERPEAGSGVHTFAVQLIDIAGNVGDFAGPVTITVDKDPPDVTITDSSGGTSAGNRSAAFDLAVSDQGPAPSMLDQVECTLAQETAYGNLTSPAPLHSWIPCYGSIEYTRLPVGSLRLSVRAYDRVGNVGSARYAWTVCQDTGCLSELDSTPASPPPPSDDSETFDWTSIAGSSVTLYIILALAGGVMLVALLYCLGRQPRGYSHSLLGHLQTQNAQRAQLETDARQVELGEPLQPSSRSAVPVASAARAGGATQAVPVAIAATAGGATQAVPVAGPARAAGAAPAALAPRQGSTNSSIIGVAHGNPTSGIPSARMTAPEAGQAAINRNSDPAPAPIPRRTYICPICNADLDSLERLNLHLDTAHSAEAPTPSTTRPAPAHRGNPQSRHPSGHSGQGELDHRRNQGSTLSSNIMAPTSMIVNNNGQSPSGFNRTQQPPRSGQPPRAGRLRCPVCGIEADNMQAINVHLDQAHGFMPPGTPPEERIQAHLAF